MSVINQMLKDLDQRTPDADALAAQPNYPAPVHSPMKIVAITTILVLVVCLTSFYVWSLQNENKALKAEQGATKASSTQLVPSGTVSSGIVASGIVPSHKSPTKEVSAVSKEAKGKDSRAKSNHQSQVAKAPVNDSAIFKASTSKAQEIKAKTIVDNGSSRVTPAKKAAVIAHTEVNVDDSRAGYNKSHTAAHSQGSTKEITKENVHSHPHIPPELKQVSVAKAKSKANSSAKPKAQANKISVSRRQLSADELAQQKIVQAEKALGAKQIAKAENLLEDVLIIKPTDSQTRKKLAALWFGRQAYQDAVNLLSQGIALNGQDSSLREMQARIYLQQGQTRAALNTLKPLAGLKDEQYQIMLANIAQQAQQNEVAVAAYKVLITMQPEMGRWQLGLAVLYDKDSQFKLASKAYAQALAKNDLSISSENFIKQRIQAIEQ
ncbi:MAG: tetratricopeptide repeat protein [Colwellia sp.]|uniref:tetratricopeptide repeat protein n=1 Tax=Colwellia sp. TaxID=56799 RepID=UPI001DC03797|nr:tetratricopeptide repeat protein [Colwellia sp.]NQY48594.1 tetratricopeptide repeat protein [Colwellia sp.]